MPDPAAIAQRHREHLAELAEIGMVMARDLRAEVEAAPTPEAKAGAIARFPAIARCVRHCVALEAKLSRDQARQHREAAEDEGRELRQRLRRRQAQVQLHMERVICEVFPDRGDEANEEAMIRLEDLRERLDDDVLDPAFADRPFPEVIATLHRLLDLPPPEALAEDEAVADQAAGHAAPEAVTQPPEPPPEPYFRYSSG